ncbi:MAG TPA: DUF4340 domain-containing protein [Anaerolineaceae bacterium]|nr:DUF4340 domain-containing protein [Anaerolineaceae bacterium]
MIKKSTWIIIIVFLVLVVAMLLIEKYPVGPFLGDPTSTPQPVIIESIDFTQVTKIQITSDSSTVELEKTDGTWFVIGENVTKASPEKVDELIYIMEYLDSKASLDPNTPMDTLGLSNPNQVINLETGNGAIYSVSIGSETPTGSGYYAQLNGGTPQIISFYAGTSLARFSDPNFLIPEIIEP